MQVLVTGGAGFIGSAMVRYIINETSARVVNVDKLTYAGNLKNLISVKNSDRYSFEQVDICDSDGMYRVFEKYQPDLVINFAAESHVDRSISHPMSFITTNILGTFTLLEIAKEYWRHLDTFKRQSFRFHHISTDEVYGDLPHPNDFDGADKYLFSESTPYAPSSPYSASKAGSDHLVKAWHRTYGLPVSITNCSNNYGPYQYPEKLIPLSIINAMLGNPIKIYGKGDQIRDWLFIEDHVRAVYMVATEGRIGDTYNIGGHNEVRNINVVELLCDILQELRPVKTDYKSLITHVPDRAGHDQRYAINADKMLNELGWKPSETFRSGLEKTVRWYLDNPIWWQSLLGYERNDIEMGDLA